MTTISLDRSNTWGVPPSKEYQTITTIFQPIFQKIREEAVLRDNDRRLLFEEIEWLQKEKFGALRVPKQYGGYGLSINDLTELLTDLAQADSNIPQSLRAHFAFVEMVLHAEESEAKREWLKKIAKGEIVGNAWTEIGSAKSGHFSTKLTKNGENYQVSGKKYYSTGTIYADWILVLAEDSQDQPTFAVVLANHESVEIVDDWNGFGQILTGSGTTTFTNTPIQPNHVLDKSYEPTYLAGFFQLVHLATLSGIARSAAQDAAEAVAKRNRTFSHSTAKSSKEDPQILQVIGKVQSNAYAVGAIVDKAAKAIQQAVDIHHEGNVEQEKYWNDQAEIEVSKAQSLVSSLTLETTTLLFDALGASATSTDKRFDRYWRNARTIVSHNPVVYKERIVGDFAVNQTPPSYVWYVGQKKDY